MEETLGSIRPHRITIQDRKTAGITGVSDCVSFDENEVGAGYRYGTFDDSGKGSPCEPSDSGKGRGRSGRNGGKLCLQFQ